MMKKRRWLLPVLLMIILVPVLSALIFSTRGLYAQRDAMVKMAERYSQTLARGIVRDESGSSTETPLQRHRAFARLNRPSAVCGIHRIHGISFGRVAV